MYLKKHPLETPENKRLAKQIIDKWSRIVFGLTTSYGSREEEEDNNFKPPVEKRFYFFQLRNSFFSFFFYFIFKLVPKKTPHRLI